MKLVPGRDRVRPVVDRGTMHPAETAAVLGGAAVLCGSWVVVSFQATVPRWEERVFRGINDLPDAVWPVAWVPMQLGSLAGSVLVASLTAALARDRRLAIALFGASQAAWWTGKAVKVLAARGRPAALLSDVRLREAARGLGYVSGHAAVAFALASAVAPSAPRRWRPAAFGVATVVGAARVYAGAHLPIDVIGGAGLGVLSGTWGRWLLGLGGAGVPAAGRA